MICYRAKKKVIIERVDLVEVWAENKDQAKAILDTGGGERYAFIDERLLTSEPVVDISERM